MTESLAPHPASRLLLRAFPFVTVALVLAGWFSVQFEGGYFDPLMFGRVFQERTIPEIREIVPTTPLYEFGYDGQMYVQIAIRPFASDLELRAAMDNAPYRLRRIGWPALVHAAGLGHPVAIIHLYLWSNLVCWLVLAVIFWRRLMREPTWKSAVGWFLLVTSVGMLSSVRCSLLDVPALLLLVFALGARQARRLWVCALLVAAAGLVKESSLLGVLLLWPEDTRNTRAWLRTLGGCTLATAPVAAWTLWLGTSFGWDLLSGNENVALPGTAAIGRLVSILGDCATQGFSRPTLWPLVTWLGLAFQLVALARWARPVTHAGRLGLAFAALLLVVGPNVWSEFVMAVPRAVLPFSVITVFVTLERRASWWWISGNVLLALHGWDLLKLPLLRHIL